MPRFTVPYSKECAYPDKHENGTCGIAHDRLALETKCIRYALRHLKSNGWVPFAVNDGEETIPTITENAVLETVFSVDCSVVRVQNISRNRRSWFDVILGNGIDVVGGDYGKLIDAEMTVIYDHNSTLE